MRKSIEIRMKKKKKEDKRLIWTDWAEVKGQSGRQHLFFNLNLKEKSTFWYYIWMMKMMMQMMMKMIIVCCALWTVCKLNCSWRYQISQSVQVAAEPIWSSLLRSNIRFLISLFAFFSFKLNSFYFSTFSSFFETKTKKFMQICWHFLTSNSPSTVLLLLCSFLLSFKIEKNVFVFSV